MARSSFRNHRKFFALTRYMGGDGAKAYGCMDLLWDAAYACLAVGPDGILTGWTVTDIEACAMWDGAPGYFVNAAVKAGLLDIGDDIYAIHDYGEWAPDFVKRRWLRQKGEMTGHDRSRPVKTGQSTDMTGPLREAKGREAKGKTLPEAAGAAPAVKEKPRSEKQVERDALFDAVAKEFFPSGVSQDDASLVGRVVSALRIKHAAPEDISRRRARWPTLYPTAGPLTPAGLAKHWDALANGRASPPPQPRRNEGIEKEADDHVYLRQLKAWNSWHTGT